MHRPVRRTYSTATGRRDVDAFERVSRFRVLAWSIVGAFLGFLLGVFLTVQGEGGVVIVAVTTLIGWAMSYFGPLLIMSGAARAGSVLYTPSGRTTPHKREYSLAESYVARGLVDESIAAFEDAVAEDPTDPIPYLRIARILRDRKDDADGASRWFRRALTEAASPSGIRLLVCKELLELCESRIGDPRRAMPVLARVADEGPESPEGVWAANELARLRAQMVEDRDPE